MRLCTAAGYKVNRHTGGLENAQDVALKRVHVNRHTGGLESYQATQAIFYQVNRHTGGLEKFGGF